MQVLAGFCVKFMQHTEYIIHRHIPYSMYHKRLSQAEINGYKGRSPQLVIAASELHALRLTEDAGCHGRGEQRPMAPAPGPFFAFFSYSRYYHYLEQLSARDWV